MNQPNDPIELALRASLEQHARQAPRADLLAERIIHAADRNSAGRRTSRRGWRTWGLPLIAAGAVGAVVAAVIGIQDAQSGPSHPQAGHSGTPPVRHSSPQATGTAAPTATTTAVPSAQTTTAVPVSELHQVQLLDLTFVSVNEGWALASADCIRGSGRCTALLHTTNGKDWQSVSPTPFNVPGVKKCAAPCVDHLRFANARTGYAFGPSALLMTTDGGATWQRLKGGALYLESLDDNVIRVTASHTGCPSWCDVRVETSAIGSTSWTPAALPGGLQGYGVQFARGGHDAYLLSLGHPAGGGQRATSVLFRSTDDGRTWHAVGEPCPQPGSEVDSYTVAGGGGDVVTVLCSPRQDNGRWFVATSGDAGMHFSSQPGDIPRSAAGPWLPSANPGVSTSLLTGDPTTVLVSAGRTVALSRDGGRSWSPVPAVTGQPSFAGFESTTVGRIVTGGNTIWTTRDAGAHWTHVTFN